MPSAAATVLVVEDDALVRSMCERLLVRLGHPVALVDSGERALDFLRSRPADVVLLDWTLPGLSGRELVQRMRELHPQLPIVLTSGGDLASLRSAWAPPMDILPKPFTPVGLGAALESVLSG